MDKYEYKVKLAQIEKLVEKKDYVTAATIADGIDWRKVRSVTTLTMIADIYEANGRLEDCYELLTMVYDRSPIARSVVYRLAEVSMKMHDFDEAISFYKEFVEIAPNDPSKYILKYQIYRERGSSVSDQITILREFKEHEYDERWSYELACLYEEAGMIEQCIRECDELILWFSEGEYVIKALELKMKYQELTAAQQEKYDHRLDGCEEDYYYDEADEEEKPEVKAESEPEEEKAEPEPEKEEKVEPEPEKEEKAESEPETEAGAETEEPEQTKPEPETAGEQSAGQEQTGTEPEAEDSVKIAAVNTGKFSTINLQKELAKGLQFILSEIAQEAKETEDEEAEDGRDLSESTEETIKNEEIEEEPEIKAGQEESEAEEGPEQEEEKAGEPEQTEFESELKKYSPSEKTPNLEELLCVDEDGQISLNMEEASNLDRQITGQITLEELLEAWEEKKRRTAEENGECRQAILCETGEITNVLDDFIPTTPRETQDEKQEAEKQEIEITEEPEQAETEDDLPQEIDIDLSDSLVSFLEQPDEPEAEQFENEKTEMEAEPETEAMPGPCRVTSDTVSMIDAIERALAAETAPTETLGRYLTDEEEKIFAYFTSVKGMRKQLVRLLGEDFSYAGRPDSAVGNLVITGHPGSGKTTLAIDIVKAFQKQRHVKGSKLAKVTADGLNKKNPADVVKKLGGGAMVIERAGALSDETVEKLSGALEEKTGGLLVILEDAKADVDRLFKKHPEFAKKFNRSIDIPIFSNDELVAFGRSYAEEQEYYFDAMAVLALYDSIGVRQTSDHVVNITEVKELLDDAIARADKKGRKLFAKLSRKRIDEYGNRLLLEEDFRIK